MTVLFWLITSVFTVIRLLIIGRIGLTGDEAHYWTYTQYPALSYYDHPPLIAWLIKGSVSLFGATEFGVRFPAVALFVVTGWALFSIAQRLYGDRVAVVCAVLINIIPVFSFLGGVMSVPDAPLAALWSLSALVFLHIMKNGSGRFWYVFGALTGLALLSKYNAVFIPLAALLFCAVSPRHRFWLRRFEPYAGLGIAVVLFIPVIIWNMQNGWASFGFQFTHGLGGSGAGMRILWDSFGRAVGAQAGYLSPLVFILMWFVLARETRRAVVGNEVALYIAAWSFPTLIAFNTIAVVHEILPHWPAMGYLLLTGPAAAWIVERWKNRLVRAGVVCAIFLACLLTVLVPLQAIFKPLRPEWFIPRQDAFKVEDGVIRAEKVDITNELYGWRDAGQAAMDAMAGLDRPFIFTHRHYIASQLGFYAPGHPRIWSLSERPDAYDFWQRDWKILNGRDGVFVTNDLFFTDPRTMYPFRSWEGPREVEITRNGRRVRLFWLWTGRGFDASRLSPDYRADERVGPLKTVMQAVRELDYAGFWLLNRTAHTPVTDLPMKAFTYVDTCLGLNSSLVVMLGMIAAILWFTRRRFFWRDLILAAVVMAVGGIVVTVLKDYFGRMRPLSIFGDQVRTFYEHLYRGSFPSGHTQISFSVAVFLASRLPRWRWLFYALAAMIGLSRIYVGSHFPLDVIAGALVGIVVTKILLQIADRKNGDPRSHISDLKSRQ